MAYPQTAFRAVKLSPGSLIHKRHETVFSTTLMYQLEVLKGTGRYDAFKLGWHPSYDDPPDVWPIPNHLFWDSDIAKWIEGACYLLGNHQSSEVDTAIHELVAMIRSAQQPDGYINIHFTVVEPEKRFTNLRDFHELYNAGHMIEAALAHQDHYHNDQLIEPILKYVDLLCQRFGPGTNQTHGYPGHPEIELALLRLYERTKNSKHLDLAKYFITERGNPVGDDGHHFYISEAKRRGDDPRRRPDYWPDKSCLWYYAAHEPITKQKSIEGHSVRAMYLLTAAADLILNADLPLQDLQRAVFGLWDNMVQRKMYVTGGIGAMKQWEGFGPDYFLPQGTDEGGCYAETCAAIGVMMLAERLLKSDLDGRFTDIMELCLYNAVLTAMSPDGRNFTYVNQLASSDKDPSQRSSWFTCACCPPNMLRLFGHVGGYIYSTSSSSEPKHTEIIVHLYTGSTLKFEVDGKEASLTQETNWPWNGNVKFRFESPSENVSCKLRIPAWADDFHLSPSPPSLHVEKGYVSIPASWLAKNPSFELSIPMTPRLMKQHPLTNQDTISVARGPIVYCVEDVDNPWVTDHFRSLQLDPQCQFTERNVNDEGNNDNYIALTVEKGASLLDEGAFSAPSTKVNKWDEAVNHGELVEELHFVPYFLRASRGGRGQARVGLKHWRK
ncbi:glycoside hydrolase family 127 protein [Cucurbitaria berberidis CBS 394.84]|uniref:Glycoside hydrolase family 127 protein n=1 Tax=Cucurbitaria berberidis CBS 394.84 TaxID=1168544 RepID=A0A9P4L955_9PLEO|nr:glycoside hydrolase family 127 protein [Cucurbitaria berberidis CBS 394.84]KAF1845869.1 glycoside hydrolase family 127 protein [Cucurbitaria berberidis CBS 394.84]